MKDTCLVCNLRTYLIHRKLCGTCTRLWKQTEITYAKWLTLLPSRVPSAYECLQHTEYDDHYLTMMTRHYLTQTVERKENIEITYERTI